MKYIMLTMGILIFIFSFFVPLTHASIVYRPFGGRVTSTTMGTITCESGIGPVTQQPVPGSISMPYFYPSGGSSGKDGSKTPPSNGNWVLGLYSSFMDFGSCHYPYPYRIPYPVYKVNLYGKSL